MASEIKFDFFTGRTCYVLVRTSIGTIWNGSSFEAYLTSNYATYDIPSTEQGTASGFYTADMPVVAAGSYDIIAKEQSGGSPAESDRTIAVGSIKWTGTAIEFQSGDSFSRIGANGAGLTALATQSSVNDIPTVAEFEARTIPSDDYVVVADLGVVQTGDSYSIVNNITHGNAAIKTAVDNIKSITDAITSSGVGLTKIPWNNDWDTEVQSEVTDALNLYDPPTKAELDTSVLSITNHGDANWIASGFATFEQASGINNNVNTLISRVPDIISLENIQIEASGALVYYGALKPTVSGRSLDVSSTGEAGLDFDNIKQATGATTLANITIPIVTDVTTKTGYKLSSDGLDSISIIYPSGEASNFREMAVQLWRRFFKKVSMTSTQLKTFADDNSTVITTQTLSDNGTTQIVGDID